MYESSTINSKAGCGQYNGNTHRYYLHREWSDEGDIACVIMLNPSYADALIWDYSSMRIMNYLVDYHNKDKCGKKYRGMYIVNLFSIVETDSDKLTKINYEDRYDRNTDEWLETCIDIAEDVFVAWGSNDGRKTRINYIKKLLRRYNKKIYRFVDQDGKAKHISRMPNNMTIKEIDISDI